MIQRFLNRKSAAVVALLCAATAWADNSQGNDDSHGNSNSCASLPGYSQLKTALDAAVNTETTGLNLNMWATIVDRDGVVCTVAFSGNNRGSQWPGSRVISAQKANTANAFSLDGSSAAQSSGAANGLALSTANLYSAVQPGGSLFGLQESNPVDTGVAYKGPSSNYGQANDPMVGNKIGGVNVFGGGLALYKAGATANSNGVIEGAVGVSGDTSCADHRIGWLVRHNLALDHMLGVGGVSGDTNRPDNMVFDIKPNPNGGTGISTGGFGHPHCLVNPNGTNNDGDPTTLPAVQK